MLCALELLHWRDALTSSTLGIWRKPRTKASFSPLQLLEFEGSLARKLRFHIFNSWNVKEVLHESFVFTSSTAGIRRKPRTKASFSWIMDAIWTLGFARNMVFFSGKRRFRCGEKLVRARDGLRRRRFAFTSSLSCARRGTDGSRWLFLFFDSPKTKGVAGWGVLVRVQFLYMAQYR